MEFIYVRVILFPFPSLSAFKQSLGHIRGITQMNNAAILLAFAYMSIVLASGNGALFLDEVKKEKRFLIWAFAIIALYELKDIGGDTTRGLYGLFIIGLILSIGGKATGIIKSKIEGITNASY